MRRVRVVIALAVLGVALAAPRAGAHALLESSMPADGELLDEGPREVLLDFTEPPDLGLSTVEVVDQTGALLETGPLELASSEREVRLELPSELADGVYTVSWRVLSTVDGHVTAGGFSFGVGVDASAIAPTGEGGGVVETGAPSALAVAGRWGFYWGLTLLLGGAIAALVIFRERLRGAALLLAIGWAAGALGLGAMLMAEASSADTSAATLILSDRGRILAIRGIVLLVAGGAALLAAIRPRALWWGILGVATLGAMFVHAQAGHAGAAITTPWLALGAQWLHLVAIGAWIGGLAWLLLGIWGTLPERRRSAVARYSTMAGIAVAGVAVTGVVRAWNEVGSWGELWGSGFGLTVVGKSVLFGGLLAIGAYNRYRLVPGIADAGRRVHLLRRTVSSELAIAAGIFGITGVMAGLVPPAQYEHHAMEQQTEGVEVRGTDFATTVEVRLRATPGQAGLNAFEVEANDFDTGEPVAARAVTLLFSLPEGADVGSSELPLEEEEPGRWHAQGTNLSVDGTWRVGVLIELADDSVQVDLELETRAAEPHVEVIEGGPGEPDLYMISLSEGRSVQAYVDPGGMGQNEVHFTFFDAEGGELPIEEIAISAAPHEGEPLDLEPRRLSPGHFVASVDLDHGSWRFSAEAHTEEGSMLTAEFEEEIG